MLNGLCRLIGIVLFGAHARKRLRVRIPARKRLPSMDSTRLQILLLCLVMVMEPEPCLRRTRKS